MYLIRCVYVDTHRRGLVSNRKCRPASVKRPNKRRAEPLHRQGVGTTHQRTTNCAMCVLMVRSNREMISSSVQDVISRCIRPVCIVVVSCLRSLSLALSPSLVLLLLTGSDTHTRCWIDRSQVMVSRVYRKAIGSAVCAVADCQRQRRVCCVRVWAVR